MGKPTFWDELFLLKVNEAYLSKCIEVTTAEQLFVLKVRTNDPAQCPGSLGLDPPSKRLGPDDPALPSLAWI